MFFKRKDGQGLVDVFSAKQLWNRTYIAFFSALHPRLFGWTSPASTVFLSSCSLQYRMHFPGGALNAKPGRLFLSLQYGSFGNGDAGASFRTALFLFAPFFLLFEGRCLIRPRMGAFWVLVLICFSLFLSAMSEHIFLRYLHLSLPHVQHISGTAVPVLFSNSMFHIFWHVFLHA